MSEVTLSPLDWGRRSLMRKTREKRWNNPIQNKSEQYYLPWKRVEKKGSLWSFQPAVHSTTEQSFETQGPVGFVLCQCTNIAKVKLICQWLHIIPILWTSLALCCLVGSGMMYTGNIFTLRNNMLYTTATVACLTKSKTKGDLKKKRWWTNKWVQKPAAWPHVWFSKQQRSS